MPQSRASTDLLQIGDVADRTGLSLRTIRHYEEVGLLPEPQRSPGGFRLYSRLAVERLLLIKRMKPLDFTLEEMRELIEVRDELAGPRVTPARRTELTERLRTYLALVESRLARLRERVESAEVFAQQLADEID
ncbi:MerR family transcriptional regulator [Terrabacter carboxydivorans]|uniref:MerR family transcriptional regulator n=1 Tax=Terrabacter carboxydivorans TaxID=619730 RepID=A0ABP5Y2M3_9MICO